MKEIDMSVEEIKKSEKLQALVDKTLDGLAESIEEHVRLFTDIIIDRVCNDESFRFKLIAKKVVEERLKDHVYLGQTK